MTSSRIVAGIAAASLTFLTISAPASTAADPTPPPTFGLERPTPIGRDNDTIIVTFDHSEGDPALAARNAVAAAAGTVADVGIERVTPITARTVSVTLDEPISAAESAKIGDLAEAVDGVKAAEQSATLTPTRTNDTYYPYLWNLSPENGSAYSVNAEAAWPSTRGAGAVVGVIDTGITPHSDLTGSTTAIVGGNVTSGFDFITDTAVAGDGNGPDSDPTDPGDYCDGEYSSWHGTHVAGTIAAIGDNSKGVVGVAPQAKVMPLRALGRCGGNEADLITAILWGAGAPVAGLPQNPRPVDVLNLSLGGPGVCGVAMQSAIDVAVARGVVVVVAAGNAGVPLSTITPASCRNVFSVVATGSTGALAGYSNYGTTTSPATIAAPGGSDACGSTITECVVSTWNAGTAGPQAESYGGGSGTSMAAPHVAAAAALLKSLDRSMSPARVQQLLTGTAKPVPGCDAYRCGSGVVNAGLAVAQVANNSIVSTLSVPTVKGAAQVGKTLSATVSGARRAAITRQWLRNGAPIARATKTTYTLTAADLGTQLQFQATAKGAGYSFTQTSAMTAVIAAGTMKKSKSPSTSGKYRTGRTVKAHAGTWKPSATSYSYQWLESGTVIAGATGTRYQLPRSMKGKYIAVRVTVTRAGYAPATVTSTKHKVR